MSNELTPVVIDSPAKVSMSDIADALNKGMHGVTFMPCSFSMEARTDRGVMLTMQILVMPQVVPRVVPHGVDA